MVTTLKLPYSFIHTVMFMKICSVEECPRKAICKGLCSKHYQKLRYAGSPTAGREVPRHGYGKHPLARVLAGMRTRCSNPRRHNAKNYYEKGITICPEWGKDTEAFILWGISSGWKPGLVIDRIDPDKDYCPENCRWITPEENNRRAGTTMITAFEKTQCLTDWAREYAIPVPTLWLRLYRAGLDPEVALTWTKWAKRK